MDTVKTIIFSACVIGVVSTMIEIASPEGTMKKQLDLVIGLVLVMTVITPFMDKDFRFRLNDYTVSYDKQVYDDIKGYEKAMVLESAKTELSDYLRKKLTAVGINCGEIIITLDVNEYNQIEITKVQISSKEQDSEKIKETIHSELPKTEVSVIAGDSS